MINYGVQNQCFTTYFSEFQPSLGLAPNSALPPFNRQQNGGCMDFQCCHTVCSIVFNPFTDDFNYGNCCDPEFGWTEECVEKAIELCYEREGGVRRRNTPNFVPLQFHLSQRSAAGPQPFRLFDQATRRLAAAPDAATDRDVIDSNPADVPCRQLAAVSQHGPVGRGASNRFRQHKHSRSSIRGRHLPCWAPSRRVV